MFLPFWIYKEIRDYIKYIPTRAGGVFIFPNGSKHFRKQREITEANKKASQIFSLSERARIKEFFVWLGLEKEYEEAMKKWKR